MHWKEKKINFVNHKKVQDQKYDIFKVHQAFTVMQGANFRKENQKKKKTYWVGMFKLLQTFVRYSKVGKPKG